LTFYTYNYITQHSQFNNAVWYVLSFLALAALLFVSIKYLRNRLVSRYRDLIVILFLAVAFLGGMQWNDYNRTKSDVEATSRVVQFFHTFSEDMGVPVEDVRTNSTYLKQGCSSMCRGRFTR
jgi:hypothetical protein